MTIAESIKAARENAGMTQEDLAERLSVSRQSVSKWEMGSSLPSPENFEALRQVLGVETPIAKPGQPDTPAGPERWKRIGLILLAFGMLFAAALLFLAARSMGQPDGTAAANTDGPAVTGVYFFDETGAAFDPDPGDGWCSFSAGSRVMMAVAFQNPSQTVNAVSVFLTPTGTETFDLRQQLFVQAIPDGRDFALFVWDIPEGMMGNMDILLECSGSQSVSAYLNVTSFAA